MARRWTREERVFLAAFGERVRARRKALGLSQEQLGHKAYLHRTYIGGIERGERNLSMLHVARLAGALEVDIEELVSGLPLE